MKFPLLLDAYGALLSERKRELIEYYYNDDYSLAEISEITGISRQGVRDSIKKSEEEIHSLEEKLGIAETKEKLLSHLDTMDSLVSSLPEETAGKLADELQAVRALLRADDNS